MYSNPPIDYPYHIPSFPYYSTIDTTPTTPSFPSFPWELFTPYYIHGSSSPILYPNHGYSPHPPNHNPYLSYPSSHYSSYYNNFYQFQNPTNNSSILGPKFQTHSNNRRGFEKYLHMFPLCFKKNYKKKSAYPYPCFKKRSKKLSQKPIQSLTHLSTSRKLPFLSSNPLSPSKPEKENNNPNFTLPFQKEKSHTKIRDLTQLNNPEQHLKGESRGVAITEEHCVVSNGSVDERRKVEVVEWLCRKQELVAATAASNQNFQPPCSSNRWNNQNQRNPHNGYPNPNPNQSLYTPALHSHIHIASLVPPILNYESQYENPMISDYGVGGDEGYGDGFSGLSSDSSLRKVVVVRDISLDKNNYDGEDVTGSHLTSSEHESNLKGNHEFNSERDMVEIVESTNNTIADEAVNPKEKKESEFISLQPQYELPLEVNFSFITKEAQVDCARAIESSNSNEVKVLQEHEDMNVSSDPLPVHDDRFGVAYPHSESLKQEEHVSKESNFHFNTIQLGEGSSVIFKNIYGELCSEFSLGELATETYQRSHEIRVSLKTENGDTDKKEHQQAIIHMLILESVAKGQVMLDKSLSLYFRANRHSWVYLKACNVMLKKIILAISLTPCRFKLLRHEITIVNDGLNDFQGHKNHIYEKLHGQATTRQFNHGLFHDADDFAIPPKPPDSPLLSVYNIVVGLAVRGDVNFGIVNGAERYIEGRTYNRGQVLAAGLKSENVVESLLTGTLRNISNSAEGFWSLTVQSEGVDILVKLLETGQTSSLASVCFLLASVMMDDISVCSKVLRAEVTKQILQLLGLVRAEAAGALKSLSSQCKEFMQGEYAQALQDNAMCTLANISGGLSYVISRLGQSLESSSSSEIGVVAAGDTRCSVVGVGQHPCFFRAHGKILKTVVYKLFEFNHETHPRVQVMACNIFLKIVQKCKWKFVITQVGENEPFVLELVSGLPITIADLEPHHIHYFYESVAHMVQAESDSQKRDEYIQLLIRLPNQKWMEIIGQAHQNVEFLKDQDVIQNVLNIVETGLLVDFESIFPHTFGPEGCHGIGPHTITLPLVSQHTITLPPVSQHKFHVMIVQSKQWDPGEKKSLS